MERCRSVIGGRHVQAKTGRRDCAWMFVLITGQVEMYVHLFSSFFFVEGRQFGGCVLTVKQGTTGAIMTPCDDTAGSLKWCCGVDKSCCNDPTQVKTLPFEFRGALPNTTPGVTAPVSTSAASSTLSSVASTTTTGAAASETTGPPKEDKSSGSLSTGAKAGIGIGAALGGLALLALGFFVARRTGHKKDVAPVAPVAPIAPVTPYMPEKEQRRYELDTSNRTELPYSPVSQMSPGKPPQHMASPGPSYEMA
jgi:hypothetical protein